MRLKLPQATNAAIRRRPPLEDSRVSDPVIVDNTPPVIKSPAVTVKDTTATLKFTAVDALSAIGSVSYTVDSSTEWNGTLPDDLVYDTTSEDFTITANKLEPGQHVIAVKSRRCRRKYCVQNL